MRAPERVVVAEFGASGSGKSTRVKRDIAAAPRRLVWDTMDEYGELARAVPTLAALLQASAGEAFALRYVPRGTDKVLAERFAAFCAIAYARGDLVMVVEELQVVTSPSWAPAEWSDCTLRGRHKRLSIYGVSQRPASVDKNFFGNATMVRTGRLNFRDDVLCMANVLGVPYDQVAGLAGFQCIERDLLTGRLLTARQAKKSSPTKRRK